MRAVLGYTLSVVVGLTAWAIAFRFPLERELIFLKASGRATGCSWTEVLRIPAGLVLFSDSVDTARTALAVTASDSELGLELVHGGPRDFWLRRDGTDWGGVALLGYLLGEHKLIQKDHSDRHVRQGDVVVDVGGHVGVFTDLALRRGASKVVAIEPEPRNFECLRRNFKAEVESGRVILVQAGAWSKPGVLELSVNTTNSGTSSLIEHGKDAPTIRVPVKRLDDIVQELRLPRVDFIKMDIEGAEEEALKGAAEILKLYRPRMVLDSYHKPDDAVRLPELIRRLNPAYQVECGSCEYHADEKIIVPHVVFYF